MICDLAETYQIYDYKSVPVQTLATLVAGLRPESRVRQNEAGIVTTPGNIILARIYDAITALSYGLAGIEEQPELLAEQFYIENVEKAKPLKGFDSGADFDKYRADMIKRITAKKAAKK